MKHSRGMLLTVLIILLIVPSTYAEQVQGTFYDTSFNELEKALVTINTTPIQKQVFSENYSFALPEGSFHIEAVSYQRGQRLIAEENITVVATDTDSVIHRDLIFFPDLEQEYARITENGTQPDALADLYRTEPLSTTTVLFLIFWIAIIILILRAFTKVKPTKTEDLQDKRHESDDTQDSLQEELKELRKTIASNDSDTQVLKPETKALYDYIHENNQVSQRELRKEFPMSDAKLSLIVTDLEERGLIKKIKRGRGNVLIDKSE